MSDAKATQEPSMEEILASIRRIISEEEVGPAKPEADAAKPAPAAGNAARSAGISKPGAEDAAIEEEDLVLTKVVQPARSEADPAPPDLELAPSEPAKDAFQDTEIEQMPSPPPVSDPDQEPLISPEVAAASAATMAQLIGGRAHATVELATPGGPIGRNAGTPGGGAGA